MQKYSLAPTRRLVIGELENLTQGPGPEPKLDLLDVGCGTGQLIAEIAGELAVCFSTLTGVDTAKNMLDLAVEKKIPQAHFVYGDAGKLSFAPGQFDILTCCHSFPYYLDKLQVLREFKRVLKPGGYITVISAAENNFYDKLVMSLVKLTTGWAAYPSSTEMAEMLNAVGYRVLLQKKLESKFFMPSIILTTAQLETSI